MSNKKIREEMHDDGSYVIKKSKKGNVFALIICLLIAFCIWAVSATVGDNAQDTGDDAKQTYSLGA